MKFISAVCPHCGKELQLPEDSDHIVCMYCAQPIDAKALLSKNDNVSNEDYQRLMNEAESLLNDDIFNFKLQSRDIKRTSYSSDFESYAAIISPALKAFCLAATENEGAVDHFAGILFDRFVKQFQSEGIKKESDPRFFDCRYMIVSFTVPAMLEQHTPAAEELADNFLAKWNAYYPKNKLGKSTFEAINGGFRKKLCFITTAVCSSLGKGDNCKELNTFRKFRDEWLAQTTNGMAKISEYYLFAPMIVRSIDESDEKDTVYHEIWKNHLAPCLGLIESNKLEKCAEQYENMIDELECKWLN